MAANDDHDSRSREAGSNDIDNLARAVQGIDPKRYFDRQAEDAWRDAALRWPVLAELLRIRVAS